MENATARLGSYKNHAKNTETMRVKRHEITVELRKSKKEDQMLKRRNINEDELTSPLKDANGQSPVTMKVEDMILAMKSSDPARQFMGVQAARKMLSREQNPPIDLMISHGIVPLCVSFLKRFENPPLQFEAAWALTNVASGNSEQTRTVIDADAVRYFVALLESPTMTVAEQSVWALGNIAGDGPVARDIVLNNNAIEPLLRLVSETTPLSFLRNIVWLMSNLCRNKNPSPPFEKIQPILPLLARLLHVNDTQVLADACWAISYVTDDENKRIQAIIDTGLVSRLVSLLDIDEPSIIVPALRSVGNIVTGTDVQTDTVINAGGLPRLAKLLEHNKNNIVKEAAWTLSNITAGNQRQIQDVIDADVFPRLRKVLVTGDFKCQKEAAWVVTNATTSGTPEQVVSLIEKFDLLKPFCDLLNSNDARTVKVVLTGISNVFNLAEKLGGTSSLCLLMEEIGALDKLEALQNHQNEEIYNQAFTLVDTYFVAQEDENLAPKQAGGEYEFTGEVKQVFEF